MRLRERDEPLDPQVERELEAVDGALGGRSVDPDLQELAELTALIADERPEPTPEWSAELDERVVARFRGDSSSSRLRTWLGGLRPMQIAAPVGALATAAVIVVVGVSSMSETGSDDVSSDLQSLPTTGQDGRRESVEPVLPEPTTTDDSAAAAASADASGTAFVAPEEGLSDLRSGKEEIAPGTEKRQIERNVSLALSTRPENVREVSDEAIGIVRSLNGIVASSQVSEAGRQASASLQLTIPTRNLDTALDRLTDLANVKSMDETTEDITKPFVSAQDRLRDAEAERRSLLQALANADTETEAEALRLQIADARDAISEAQAEFENIARRARLSDISLTIVGDPTVDEDRSIGDWFDDAVSVLRDVAGVLLISAAILVPLGILVAIGWLVVSRARRRRRERALD
jgi:hypothetical protein